MITTALTQRFGLEAPIILAPMAGVSGGALAAAVSNAGGLGIIGGGYAEEPWLRRELAAAGNTPVGVGFITWALEKQPHLLEIAMERGPKAVFLSFGELEAFAPIVKHHELPLIAQVQSVRQAQLAAKAGADLIVAQGGEAGGHGGLRGTLALVPAVVDAVGNLPVVAAGGIADGRGLAAALMLGAAGVLCGTAFYASLEALSHGNAKRAAIDGSGDDTERSAVFDISRGYDWPEPYRLRTLKNSFTRQWAARPDALRAAIDTQKPRYASASAAGDVDVAAVIVGEAVDLVRKSEAAARTLERMVREAEQILEGAAGLLHRP